MSLNYKYLPKCGILAIFVLTVSAYATTPFSQYGMIQNVQDYSSNPFYNSNTGIITSPKIVYATGPSLKANDCERVVQALVENECAQRNRCQTTQLSDIRPSIMIQLSSLPGYTYASTCVGYIDTIYEKYVKDNKSVNFVTNANFPTVSSTQKNNGTPQWKVEYNNRANELKALQAQTQTNNTLVASAFPTTFDDLSFAQQNAIKQEGYASYWDKSPYIPLDIERTENAYVSIPELVKEDEKSIKDCIASIQAKLDGFDQQLEEIRKKMMKMEADGTYLTAVNSYELLEEEAKKIVCIEKPKHQVMLQNAPCTCSINHRFREEYLQSRTITCAPDSPSELSTKPQIQTPTVALCDYLRTS